ncbi:BamA/TamA family outer membrane protein [Gramella sp. GC03-9]|uniref:BamA/TamA family outer membrane protein n=1 Tax=Christiangramia oceanisediminis TaxID=2920386 RepID=A0A9X2KYB3_9FLAO|nr:BamA/TamA family outer membrane protein [Gramella oceanisediminis]MCP9200487.1 BamA/TamA family outer membrane protein [Gramella oceanisediminis]
MKQSYLFLILILIYAPVFSQGEEIVEEKQKKVKIAGVPYLNYSRTVGFSYGLLGAAFYKLNANDSISPSSSTTIAGIYSTSESYIGMGIQQFYFAEDRWRTKLAGGIGNGNLQVYQSFYSGGSFIDYSTKVKFIMGEVARRVAPDLYVGLSGGMVNARTEFDLDLPLTDRRPTIDIPINYVGTFIQSDSRNNVNYPNIGHNIQASFKNSGEWLGNETNFNQLELSYDLYKPLMSGKDIFLARYYSISSFGDVPFVGQNTVGGDNIRGYSEGRYRDDQLYSIQAEYRYNFESKFGMVFFGGFATVVPEISEIFEHDLLPGIGTGIRYLLLPKEKINIGLDVAAGKGDWSLSFRISDAFAR